jgi:hypothetical protein
MDQKECTSPEYRFMRDPQYNAIVKSMIKMIEEKMISPSELREMAMFACIQYEMTHVRESIIMNNARF